MRRNYTNTFILNSLKLPVISDLDSLSNSIGISKKLIYLLSCNNENYYTKFNMPKRDGTDRQILCPSFTLKLVQRWILAEILEKINVSKEAMAFRKGYCGTKKNAEYHRFSIYVLQIDLDNFFTSIKSERVFYLFRNMGYNFTISNILTNLCTYNGYLPQGAVCSPYLSNLICYKLDRRIEGLCSKRDVLYSRYADDLTFSCDNKLILSSKIKNVVQDIVEDEGFKINSRKTKLSSPSSRKRITGIIVNGSKLKASKELKKKVRAMIHRAIVSGDYSSNYKIRGYISYINFIEDSYKNKIIKYINTLIQQKDYKHFTDIVDAFNENRLYEELETMVYEDVEEVHGYDDFLFGEMHQVRYEFLKERGLIQAEDCSDSINDEEASL